jgi:5-methylcytosine-specific restriction endonuclease McrA
LPYRNQEKQREYQRIWIQQRRARGVAEAGGECLDCGSAERLQFHHKDPSQKVSHKIWSWRDGRMREEIAKCELLCVGCHQKRTNYFRSLRKVGVVGVEARLDSIAA